MPKLRRSKMKTASSTSEREGAAGENGSAERALALRPTGDEMEGHAQRRIETQRGRERTWLEVGDDGLECPLEAADEAFGVRGCSERRIYDENGPSLLVELRAQAERALLENRTDCLRVQGPRFLSLPPLARRGAQEGGLLNVEHAGTEVP